MGTNIPSEDEEFGILLDTEEDRPFLFNVDEPETDDKAKPAEKLAELEAENRALKAARDVQRNVPFEESYREPVQRQQVQQQQVQQDPSELNKQIETELFGGKALSVFQKFNAAAIDIAEQRAMQRLVPLQASMVKQQIGFFKQTTDMEPEVAKEFDKLVKQYKDEDLAKVDPSQVPEILANLKRVAIGTAYESGSIGSKRQVPNYGGSTSGSSGTGQKQVKITDPVLKEAVRTAREDWGWDEKKIYNEIVKGHKS